MVDVSDKPVSTRTAEAVAVVRTRPEVVAQVFDGDLPKGDAVAVARIAGIMAAKRTPELVPLCHPLPLSKVTVDITPGGRLGDAPDTAETPAPEVPATGEIHIRSLVRTRGVTGVEMEALTAASVAALTVFDMIKALDKAAVVAETRVLTKTGGTSGDWAAPGHGSEPAPSTPTPSTSEEAEA
ncbi:cyclic pyranopterin monophosphate synthase MoaC [Brevibacterium litoralis]|uniref:cyclic pyranopterin monophosphate synthase MoaC n=1 Tax=Brevibacterium litoralis TaxID=3138935 RepID=UPI003D9A5949